MWAARRIDCPGCAAIHAAQGRMAERDQRDPSVRIELRPSNAADWAPPGD